MKKSLLTVNEVSSFLHVHPNTIYKWTDEGKIPFIKINRQIRFEKEEMEEFIKKNKSKHIELAEFLPKFDLSLEKYDTMFLKGRNALSKKSKRWNYGFGGVYTRKTKSGADRWYIWHYDRCRKRVQKVVKNARSRQEAVIALNMEVARAFSQEYQGEQGKRRISIKGFSDVYLENYAKPKKKSWRSDEKYLRAQLIPFFGEMELSEITPLHVNQFIVKRQKDGVRNSTINRELTVLKKMLSLAIEWEFDIESNPVKKGNYFPEEEYKRSRVLSYEEERELFKVAAPHLKPILTCALSTAMRYSEILGLKWEDIDLEQRQITVKAESSKSGKHRVIPINDTLYSVLEKLKKLNGGVCEHLFLYEDPKTGKSRPVKTMRRAFVMACRRAGIKNLTFHDLRHTIGSRLIAKGADPVSVKDILGHANLKTTEIYLHSSLKQMREAVKLIDDNSEMSGENLEKLLHICNTAERKGRERQANVFFSVN